MTTSYSDYKIAWICALSIELASAEGMLDDIHDPPPQHPAHDSNRYVFGRIGKHNVVLACLPAGVTGTVSAAEVVGGVRRSFPALRFGLMVGIGGGVPDMESRKKHDIRLGDVVVSQPSDTFGGVVQYDFGRFVPGRSFTRTGQLNRPPNELLTALAGLQAKHKREGSQMVSQYVSEMLLKWQHMVAEFRHPGLQHDLLFEATYDHPNPNEECKHCDTARLVPRPARDTTNPAIFYGTIASGNAVMRDGVTRNEIAQELDALCFEMEAAGIMNSFPCLVIRGVCDYADSHKHKRLQGYASAVAAAYAKELLSLIPVVGENTQSGSQEQTAVSQAIGPNMTVYGGINSYGGQNFVGGTFTGDLRIG